MLLFSWISCKLNLIHNYYVVFCELEVKEKKKSLESVELKIIQTEHS